MKDRYIVFFIVIVTLLIGCSEEVIVTSSQLEQGSHVVLKAYNGSGEAPSSRLAYKDDSSVNDNKGVTVTWSAGDAFYMKSALAEPDKYVHGQMNIIEKETAYSNTESFTGVLSESLDYDKDIIAYYPSAAYDLESNSFLVDVRQATQKVGAPMAHLSATNYMVGKGTLKDGVSFVNGNKVAIVRFDLSVPAMGTEVGISEFQIESTDLHTVGTLDADDNSIFTENQFFEKHRQTIYLDGYKAGTSETNLSVYVTMLPTTLNKEMSLKLLLANGDIYSTNVEFSNGNGAVVACNRYYILKDLSKLMELDYSWYTHNPNALNFEISNESQLFAFARIVNGTAPSIEKNDFAGKTVTLKENIALKTDWIPIGASYDTDGDFCFRGTFDGNNHTISNLKLYVEVPSDKKYDRFYCGFFGKAEGATIKNLTLQGDAFLNSKNKQTHGNYYLGGLLGFGSNKTLIENCRNEISLMAYNLPTLKMGGLVGSLHNSSMQVCANVGDIVAISVSHPDLGGIVGYGDTDIVIACHTENVEMKSTQTGSISYSGGIAGRLDYKSTLVASYSLIDDMFTDAWGVSTARGGLAAHVGSDGSWGNIYGCYAVITLWDSVDAHNKGNINVGTDVNSKDYMQTLNEGIATWNATLSGVLDPAYCRYVYKQMADDAVSPHLVLEKQSGINTGQLEDMGNGGQIGVQQ